MPKYLHDTFGDQAACILGMSHFWVQWASACRNCPTITDIPPPQLITLLQISHYPSYPTTVAIPVPSLSNYPATQSPHQFWHHGCPATTAPTVTLATSCFWSAYIQRLELGQNRHANPPKGGPSALLGRFEWWKAPKSPLWRLATWAGS